MVYINKNENCQAFANSKMTKRKIKAFIWTSSHGQPKRKFYHLVKKILKRSRKFRTPKVFFRSGQVFNESALRNILQIGNLYHGQKQIHVLLLGNNCAIVLSKFLYNLSNFMQFQGITTLEDTKTVQEIT